MSDVELRRNIPLEMRDGVVLAADVRLPVGAGPRPAVVAIYPYLKDGLFGALYAPRLEWLAGRGFATVIVDVRGTGASQGRKTEGFSRAEADDVYDVVQRVAGQTWCDGAVGIWGRSYGGIAGYLGLAAKPPALRAVAAVEPSSDPYLWEVMRYGCPSLAALPAEWGARIVALSALPPLDGTPDCDEERVWAEHLDALTPWHHAWREHPHYDDFWRGQHIEVEGSEIPTLIYAGWYGMNPDGAWSDFDSLAGPRRIVVGPWDHEEPDRQDEQPIDVMEQVAAWFERHLGGDATADAELPPVVVWASGAERWEGYESWPPPTAPTTTFLTCDGGLEPAADGLADAVELPVDATIGMQTGFGFAARSGTLGPDEARSLTFTSAPLDAPLELAGRPVLRLAVRSHPASDVAVRLTDVGPDRASRLLAKGLRRLGNPPPYTAAVADPGGDVEIALDPLRHRVLPGHRLRVSLAQADFPAVLPHAGVPAGATTILVGGDRPARLTLPVLGEAPEPALLALPPPSGDLPSPTVEADLHKTRSRDSETGSATLESVFSTAGCGPTGVETSYVHRMTLTAVEDRPAATAMRTATEARASIGGRDVVVTTESFADPRECTTELRVEVGGETVYERRWQAS